MVESGGWSQAGPSSFTDSDATLTSVGGPWYSAKQFTSYSLKVDWRLAGDDNSGVFIGFPPSDDPWPAVDTGYEVQIDATACDLGQHASTVRAPRCGQGLPARNS